MTRISIVTISFNQADFLERTVLSVLEQHYPDVEYIVVDPGSTDGSRAIIERYCSGIAKAILQPDKGPADGLRQGFSEATGDVFGFLNADDILLPGSLERVGQFFHEYPNCDVVFGNGFIIDGEDKRLRHVKARDFTVHRYLHDGTRFLQQSTFFRREAFTRAGGFNLANKTCWDGELFVTMVKQGAAVGYIDADLAGFRIHPASISGSGRVLSAYRNDCDRIFRELEGREWGLQDHVWHLAYRAEGAFIRIGSKVFKSRGSNR